MHGILKFLFLQECDGLAQRRPKIGLVSSIFSKSRSEDKLHRIQIESVGNLEHEKYELGVGGTARETGGRDLLFGVSHPSESTEFSAIVSQLSSSTGLTGITCSGGRRSLCLHTRSHRERSGGDRTLQRKMALQVVQGQPGTLRNFLFGRRRPR